MVSVKDAFTDAWRSYRIQQGDSPTSLPDPLGRGKQPKSKNKKRQEVDPIDSGGGFFVDEEEQPVDETGLSQEEEEENEIESNVEHIPLSSVPDALATLSLPSNDAFVLDLFAQTAVYLNNDSRRRRRPAAADSEGAGGADKMVSLHDFQRVAEVLLDGEQEEAETSERGTAEEDEEEEEEEQREPSSRRRPMRAAASKANKRRKKQIQDEDVEAISDDEDVYSVDFAAEEEGDEEEVGSKKPKRAIRLTHKNKDKEVQISPRKSASGGLRRGRKENKRKEETTETDEEEEEREGHLSATQRRTVHAAFALFTNKLRELKKEPLDDQPRLSKDDLRLLVTHVGEKISEKEIEEMIEEGMRFFAKASSRDVTRQTAKLRREAAAGRSTARGEVNRAQTVGIDEFAGVLLKGRLI